MYGRQYQGIFAAATPLRLSQADLADAWYDKGDAGE